MSTGTITEELTGRLRAAADYADEHGWTQGTEQNPAGEVCLTGAVRLCAPQVGDFYLVRAVLRHRRRAESWNDEDGRTQDEVVSFLRTTDITDADLAATFGPQWEPIVALVRRAAAITADESRQLVASWAASWAASRAASLAASRAASLAASRAASRAASWDASRAASLAASRAASRAASWDASRAAEDAGAALHARDLIAETGFTAEHYRKLTGSWASVMGPVHPDDERDGLLVAARAGAPS